MSDPSIIGFLIIVVIGSVGGFASSYMGRTETTKSLFMVWGILGALFAKIISPALGIVEPPAIFISFTIGAIVIPQAIEYFSKFIER